ncbi:MAG: hypothetical protein QM648_01100 [Solirubrobacterales bacterium]
MVFAILLFLLLLIVALAIALYARRSPRLSRAEIEKIGPMPTGPINPGTGYLFPGQGQLKDADHRETAVTAVDPHDERPLPPGIKRS